MRALPLLTNVLTTILVQSPECSIPVRGYRLALKKAQRHAAGTGVNAPLSDAADTTDARP